EVSHRKGLDETFRTTVRMRDVVEQFHMVDLTKTVMGHDFMASGHASAVRCHEFWLLAKFLTNLAVGERIERWVENVDKHNAAIDHVAPNRREARELVLHRRQMLKWAKRDRRECESLPKIEVPHISLDQTHSILHALGLV